MVDNLTPEKRSKIMRSIRSTGTRPEITVRAIVRSLGRSYRLNKPKLPGRPDLIFPGKKKTIFVHGCFWHAHFVTEPSCKLARIPSGKVWQEKLLANLNRDAFAISELKKLGWDVIVIWECELKHPTKVRDRLLEFLEFSSNES